MKVKRISFPNHVSVRGRAKNSINLASGEWRDCRIEVDHGLGVIWVYTSDGKAAYTFGLAGSVVEWEVEEAPEPVAKKPAPPAPRSRAKAGRKPRG